jgi:hypothetical protein
VLGLAAAERPRVVWSGWVAMTQSLIEERHNSRRARLAQQMLYEGSEEIPMFNRKLFVVPIALAALFAAPVSQAQTDATVSADSSAPLAPQAAPLGPPPQSSIPAPPQPAGAPPVAGPALPDGQWIYTSQYGWLWAPYGQPYTYVDPGTYASYEYVYYPAFGWRWLSSPWVLNVGPNPYWGVRGRAGFAWYAHPWFQSHTAHYGRDYHATPHAAAHASFGFHGGGGGFHGGGHGRR